jgi:hypothetical protein
VANSSKCGSYSKACCQRRATSSYPRLVMQVWTQAVRPNGAYRILPEVAGQCLDTLAQKQTSEDYCGTRRGDSSELEALSNSSRSSQETYWQGRRSDPVKRVEHSTGIPGPGASMGRAGPAECRPAARAPLLARTAAAGGQPASICRCR